MAKLLKHLGIGYGSNKKSETFDFRAKTLPASTTDRNSVHAACDSLKSSGRRNTGSRSHTVDGGDTNPSSHSSRRASNETFLTIPARGLRARSERDWSFRGTKNRDPLQPAVAFDRPRDSESTGSKAPCDADTKDLRRSVTVDEISSKKSSRVTLTLGEYSDPFDLKKGATGAETETVLESTSGVILPLSEDDYSVPYEMKDQHQELQLEVGELNDIVSRLAVADTSVAAKYDDPYEENPIAAKSFCSDTDQRSAEVPAGDVITGVMACDADASTEQEMSCCTSAAVTEEKSECSSESECTAVPVRSFELSAEYGGFFVDPAVTQKHVENYTDQKQPLPQASIVQAARVESSASGAGFYDEPWDLSTVTRGIQEQLRESSEKDVGRALVDNCRQTTTDVYAQPHRGEKRHQRLAGINATDPRVTDGPCYGVLCERISDNGFMLPPPLAQRKAGMRSSQPGTWTTDSRPLDDYDVPWDQKKKLAGRTSSDAGRPALTVQPNRMQSTSSFVEHDVRLPLEQQIWYHGSISRRTAEQLLRMCREGSYLVRTSESNRLDYSLSVRSAAGFMHMKIVANHDGRFILGQFSQPFCSIAQMVHYYTMNKLPIKGAEHISLAIPVPHQC